MATYAVGDIQGCLQPLKTLLRAVDFNPSRDVLWSVGDIINRGPRCLKTLRYLHDMRDSLIMVLGNHDLHLLAVAAGVKKPSRSDTLAKILAAPDRDALLGWLVQQPLIHREKGHTLVHAGIPPQWSIPYAVGRAREVETTLKSAECTTFLKAMYGNEPTLWLENLRGMTRLRVITNYLTRMRYCTPEGVLDLKSKGPEPDPDAGNVAPWFSHPNRAAAAETIIFGHWASLEGCTDTPNIIGLDSGCVWGGSLSLYCLETGEMLRCRCREGRSLDEPEAVQRYRLADDQG